MRLALEERASFSPDALTGMEANLRFGGPETLGEQDFRAPQRMAELGSSNVPTPPAGRARSKPTGLAPGPSSTGGGCNNDQELSPKSPPP